MGSGSGWRCKSCGAGEEYWTGCGMMSFDVAETRALIARGEFGAIAKQLLSDDFPLDMHTIDERAFYRCPGCGKLVAGMAVMFCAEDAFEMMLPVPPEKCPECDATGAKKGSKVESCPTCHGTGQVRVSQRTPLGMFQTTKTCDDCHGTGKKISEPCTYCKGKGYVKVTKKIEVTIPAGIDDGELAVVP